MNRREFTKGLMAAGVVPAVPIPALAKVAPVAAATKDSMYIWASFVTRVHNKCSPDMLTRLLKIDPAHSAKLYAKMLSDGSITAPNAFGISQSTNPLNQQFATVTGHGKNAATVTEKPETKLKKVLSEQSDETEISEPIKDDEDLEGDLAEDAAKIDEDFTQT